jgi:hypothetical protein
VLWLNRDFERYSKWLRAQQREHARRLGVELPQDEEVGMTDVLSAVRVAHAQQRDVMRRTRAHFGGISEQAAGQLAAAMATDSVKCGSYDLAMRAAGSEREPLRYACAAGEAPKPYDIALARLRAAGGAR